MTAKILATVVTSFLGAGKTSLIRHLLEHSRGRRLALLINEFGSLGIDKAIIGGCGIATCREEDGSSSRTSASVVPWPTTSCRQ
jgi:cobalamin biosynthesis protein CobW